MKRMALALVVAVGLSGCAGGSDSAMGSAPPPPATSVDFTTFTKQLLSGQSDTAAPVAVTASEFVFPDDDNTAAFASVLSGP